MAFVPTPNTAEVVLHQTIVNQECNNVLYFTSGTAWDATNLDALRDTLYVWGDSTWKLGKPNDWTFVGVTITDISQLGGEQLVENFTTPIVGSGTNASTPAPVTAGFVKRTGKVGRAFRGYIYQSGIEENQVGSAAVYTATMDNMAAQWGLLIGAAQNDGFQWVLRQTQIDGVVQNPRTTVPITGIDYTTTRVRIQKRRRNS